MSDDNEEVLVQDELTVLKARAQVLGISFHPSIGLDKLREKVNAATSDVPEVSVETVAQPAVAETPVQKRLRLKQDAMRLIRIRLTCMNPAKAEWEGEIFTVGNSAIGSVKKFIPFNADDGWHVPHIMYEQLLQRQCQVFTTVTDSRGNKIRRGKLIREFAIEVLPQLTKAELAELAQRQAIAKSID